MHVYSSLRDTVRSYVVIQTYLAGGAIYDYARLATNGSKRVKNEPCSFSSRIHKDAVFVTAMTL